MSVDKNMNVLIVDDYKTMLRIIGNLLKQLGFSNVDEATDGSMALHQNPPATPIVLGVRYGCTVSACTDGRAPLVGGLAGPLVARSRAPVAAKRPPVTKPIVDTVESVFA